MNEVAIVVSNHNKNNNIKESIDNIVKSGFKNVFIQWYKRDYEVSLKEQIEYIKSKELNIIFAHLDYLDINEIWIDTPIGDKVIEDYKKDIYECKNNDIDLVVMHLTRHYDGPLYNEIGLNRLKRLANYARELNVKIAFENTIKINFLDYVIRNIDLDNIGICLDSGHLHCYSNDNLNEELYNNRIFAVHIHDNHGLKDEHLIPYDGTINWDVLISKLRSCNYKGPITLESVYQKNYLTLSLLEFYQRCYCQSNALKDKFDD